MAKHGISFAAMQSHTPELHVLPDLGDAAAAMAEVIAQVSRAAIADRGQCSIALSGGSTPGALYDALASPPYAEMVDWTRWQVFWSDERCVPPDHPDSNYGMARRSLLARVPIPEDRVHRVRGEAAPALAANSYEVDIRTHVGALPVFDLVLLGLGEDGHVASLFPESPALDERGRLVVSTAGPAGVDRVTFTPPLINASRHVAFLVSGASKAGVVSAVLGARAPTSALPATLVRPTDGRVHWFLSADAATALRS